MNPNICATFTAMKNGLKTRQASNTGQQVSKIITSTTRFTGPAPQYIHIGRSRVHVTSIIKKVSITDQQASHLKLQRPRSRVHVTSTFKKVSITDQHASHLKLQRPRSRVHVTSTFKKVSITDQHASHLKLQRPRSRVHVISTFKKVSITGQHFQNKKTSTTTLTGPLTSALNLANICINSLVVLKH